MSLNHPEFYSPHGKRSSSESTVSVAHIRVRISISSGIFRLHFCFVLQFIEIKFTPRWYTMNKSSGNEH